MMNQVAVFAVDRNKELGSDDFEHALELGTRRVARDVDIVNGFVKNFGALLEKVIDHAPDRLLVAGNEFRAHEDEVTGAQLDFGVLALRDPNERGTMLALTAGGKHDHFFARIFFEI